MFRSTVETVSVSSLSFSSVLMKIGRLDSMLIDLQLIEASALQMNIDRIFPILSIHFFSIEAESLNQFFFSVTNKSFSLRKPAAVSQHVSFNYRCRHQQLEEKRSAIEPKGSGERNVCERRRRRRRSRRRNQFSRFLQRSNFFCILHRKLTNNFQLFLLLHKINDQVRRALLFIYVVSRKP